MARRWGRTAVGVLLSDCQYRKGTEITHTSELSMWYYYQLGLSFCFYNNNNNNNNNNNDDDDDDDDDDNNNNNNNINDNNNIIIIIII